MEATVRALRTAFTGEHARRVFALTLEREHAGGEGVEAGQVLLGTPAQDLAPVLEARERDAGDACAAQARACERLLQHLIAHGEFKNVAAVLLAQRRPFGQGLHGAAIELGLELVVALDQRRDGGEVVGPRGELGEHVVVRLLVAECADRAVQVEQLARDIALALRPRVVAGGAFLDLVKVADAVGGDHRTLVAVLRDHVLLVGLQRRARLLDDGLHEGDVETVRTRIVELARDRAVDRHLVGGDVPQLAGALDLLLDVSESVEAAALVELVDRDKIGVVEHVDLLELGRGAVLGGHDVQARVAVVGDLGVRLADAARLDDDEVEAGGLRDVDGGLDVLGQR